MRNRKRGFTLIELLITIILATSGLMVLVHLMGVAMFADSNLEYRLIALSLANEKLEELKDSDYNDIASVPESSIPSFPWVDDRIVTVTGDTGLKEVQVEVRWTQQGGQQSVNVHTYIADY